MGGFFSKFWMLPIVWVLLSLGVGYLLFLANKKATLDVDGKPKKGLTVKARLSGVVVTFLVVLFVLAGGTIMLFREYKPFEEFDRNWLSRVGKEHAKLKLDQSSLEACLKVQGRGCDEELRDFRDQVDTFVDVSNQAVEAREGDL